MLRLSEQERKDYIAKYAANVFAKKGYQLATLQDIASKAGISKAGVYHYFKSKEEILAYVLIRKTEELLIEMKKRAKEINGQKLNQEESVRQLILDYAKLINTDKDIREIVLRERHQLTGINKQKLLTKEQAIFHLIRDQLKKIPAASKNIDPNVTSFLIISMSHWLGYWFKEKKKFDFKSIIEQNIEVILRGMLK